MFFFYSFSGILSWYIGLWVFQGCWWDAFGFKWLKIGLLFFYKRCTPLIFQPPLGRWNLGLQAKCRLCFFQKNVVHPFIISKIKSSPNTQARAWRPTHAPELFLEMAHTRWVISYFLALFWFFFKTWI